MATKFRIPTNLNPNSVDPRYIVLLVSIVPFLFMNFALALAVAILASLLIFILPKYVYLNFKLQKTPMTVHASDFGLNRCCTKGTPRSIPWSSIIDARLERKPSVSLKIIYLPRHSKCKSAPREVEWPLPDRPEDIKRLEADIKHHLALHGRETYARASGEE